MKNLLPNIFRYIFFTILLSSCASVNQLINNAEHLANKNNLNKEDIPTGVFSLVTYSRITDPQASLHVYIEGDGNAFSLSRYPSKNPTPHNPISLKLATIDPHSNIIYIARPFQLLNDPKADQKYWTTHRFSQEVVDATNQVIEIFKDKYHFKEIRLFGFSGGGTIAALIASQREDVGLLVTIAGNLDHRKHSEIHGVSYLDGSLNPVDHVDQLRNTKQIHFVGEKDKIVPVEIVNSYQSKTRLKDSPNFRIIKVPDVTHNRGWTNKWEDFLNKHIIPKDFDQ